MIYARKDRYGMLWQVRKGNNEELIIALEYAKAKHGDGLSGKVFGRSPAINGVEPDISLPVGTWLFELKGTEPP